MTTKQQLNQLLPPAEQQTIVDRAIAADALRRVARAAWLDPCGTRDRELRVYKKLARRRGISEHEIQDAVTQGRREAINGTG
ncbi:hypothetical protein ACHABQ_03005 [Nesterenkonia aurantiaca]|uniref:hypothetical protein n=1 Tax=Nesterenkonia aurantiaca TaxID=1436010 RepID=UPI003EE693DC